ncbi:MAG: GNAT family N-acetyltransferase [Fimbriimonas sp.]
MKIVVERLDPEEWQAYRDLRLEALKTDPHAFGSSYVTQVEYADGYWKGRLEQAQSGNDNLLLFARENDRLIGMVGAFIIEEGIAYVIAMFVRPEARGRGIGKLLLQTLISEIDRWLIIHTARLTVNKKQAPAFALYTSLGFEVVSEISGILGDGLHHEEWVMEKRLGSGPTASNANASSIQ